MQNKLFLLPIFVTILLISFGYYDFNKKVTSAQVDAYKNLDLKVDALKQYTSTISSIISSLKNTIKTTYKESIFIPNPMLQNIKFYKKYEVYAIPGTEYKQSATLSFAKSVNPFIQNFERELNAVLSIEPQLEVLSKMHNTSWIYYTSKSGFLYMAPKYTLSEFIFSSEQYKHPFWVDAVPLHNPEYKQVVTSVYQDGAGKGSMITISDPLIIDGILLGVISIDVSVEHLKELLYLGDTTGSSSIVDEYNNSIVSLKEENKGDYYYKKEIFDSQLYLEHQISYSELAIKALEQSASTIILILIGIFSSFQFYILYIYAAKNKQLMHIDPLTKLNNRRGFHNVIDPMYDQILRDKSEFSLLLLDIDDFKAVNDNYGHNIGDEVLESIGAILLDKNRLSTVVTRWGGEEFLLFIQKSSAHTASDIATRITDEIASTKHSSKELEITVSIGLCTCHATDTFDSYVHKADQALYFAKHNGKNQVIDFNDIKSL